MSSGARVLSDQNFFVIFKERFVCIIHNNGSIILFYGQTKRIARHRIFLRMRMRWINAADCTHRVEFAE